jgi:hypothetical protein
MMAMLIFLAVVALVVKFLMNSGEDFRVPE